MDSDALVRFLQEAVPGFEYETAPTRDLHATAFVPREAIVTVCRALRDSGDLQFALLADLTAVDLWPGEPRFVLVYTLVSIEHRLRVRLKVRLSGDAARVGTVCGVWPAANWIEREVWDLFGIVFDGHPDPRRLLMPEDWDGHPLRKDYPVQVKLPARTAEPLQVTEEEFRANLERDRLARH
jgi:NADH-quinone oxidoreductase subunit C